MLNDHKLAEGGRGLKLMWQVADELSYTRISTTKNCLLLVKSYEPNPLEQPKTPPKGKISGRLMDLLNPFHGNKSKQEEQPKIYELPLKKTHLKVKTELNAVNQVLQWFEQLESLPIPKRDFWECQLALVEGFTNAVRHAHKGMSLETPIELEVIVFNNHLEMRVWDYGQPFDLKAKLREMLTSKIASNNQINEQEYHF
jgi:serine/threonine-protein kinase RsbW